MQEPTSPTRRHSVHESVHSPTLSFDNADMLENSDRARFSLDLDDPLDPTPYPESPPKALTPSLFRRILVIAFFILLWYIFSLLLSLYNKWMFAPLHLNFPFPLFVTSLHMVVQFILSGIVLWWFPRFRPAEKELLSLRDYTYPSPTGFSNLVLKLDPVDLRQEWISVYQTPLSSSSP